MADNVEVTRFRSFAERYLIARAHLFDPDPEKEEAQIWACLLRARTAYRKINEIAKTVGTGEHKDGEGIAQF